jgi:hypothetical protein
MKTEHGDKFSIRPYTGATISTMSQNFSLETGKDAVIYVGEKDPYQFFEVESSSTIPNKED